MTKSKKLDFRTGEFVVYPAHGVGQVTDVEEQEVAGVTLELFVISFEKDKMTLRVAFDFEFCMEIICFLRKMND